MKKIILTIFSLILVNSLFSQKINEFEFHKFEYEDVNIYNLLYSEETKTYVYTDYDDEGKYYIISNKGNSKRYTFISVFDLQFDKNGNYYVSASINQPETEQSKYYFLINGQEKLEYEFIWYPITKHDEIIYFIAQEDSMNFLVSYNTKTNKFNFGKKYKNIAFSKIDEKYKWEPSFELGFTKKGEPYYIAEDGEYAFLVIGSAEQKKYSSIRDYRTYEDLKGNICYNAIVKEGDNQYGVFVQGNKEYKKFNATLGPVVFKSDNTPVYVGSTETFNEYYSQFIIEGEKTGKVYNGYIYDLTITPNGKVAYTATDTTSDGKSYTRVVIDGKEQKKYENVYRLNFLSDDTPVYVGVKGDKEHLVVGNKENPFGYSSILNINISPKDEVAFLGVIYGNDNEEDQNYFIHIGNKKFGPYPSVPYSYSEGLDDFITFNEKGNYAFIIMNENSEQTIISNYFKCDYFNAIWEMDTYENDFYYLAMKTISEGKSSYQVFKNGKAIGNTYDQVSNFNLNKEQGVISFTALKENTAYFVKIDL